MPARNSSSLKSKPPGPPDPAATLRRLVKNLHGFAYRRRHDPLWTMEWVSDHFRGITGYDPHRFIRNRSLSFAELILPEDRARVAAQIADALNSGRRTTVHYRIMAAHRALVTVEDRLVGVCDAAGAIIAVEGIIDHAPGWASDRLSHPPGRRKPATRPVATRGGKGSSNPFVSSHEQA